MSHPNLLGSQIEQVICGSAHLNGHPLCDLHAVLGQLVHLVRVVGQQPQALYTQLPQDLRAGVIFSLVPLESQRQVGFQGVHPLLLQLVGPELVDQADAPPFLAHIQEDAPSLLLDLGHGGGQLLAAVTAEGAEGVAGEALGVDPAEDVLAVADVPLDQGDVVLSVQAVHEAVGDELAVFGG